MSNLSRLYDEDQEEDVDDTDPVEQSLLVQKYLEHLNNQEEWSDTEWLTDDFS